MKNKKFYTLFMLLMISFATVSEPLETLASTPKDLDGEEVENVEDELKDTDIVETNEKDKEEKQQNNKSKDKKEIKKQEDKEPVKNKGDPKKEEKKKIDAKKKKEKKEKVVEEEEETIEIDIETRERDDPKDLPDVGTKEVTGASMLMSMPVAASASERKRFKSRNSGNWSSSSPRNIAWVELRTSMNPRGGKAVGTRYKVDNKNQAVYCLNWNRASPRTNGNLYERIGNQVTKIEYTAMEYGYGGSRDRTGRYTDNRGRKYGANERYYISQMGVYFVTNDQWTPKNDRLRINRLIRATRDESLKHMTEAQSRKMMTNLNTHYNHIRNNQISKPSKKTVSIGITNKNNNKLEFVEGRTAGGENYVQSTKALRVNTKGSSGSFRMDRGNLKGAYFIGVNSGTRLKNAEVLRGDRFYIRYRLGDMPNNRGTIGFTVRGEVTNKKLTKYGPVSGQTGYGGETLQRILQVEDEKSTTSNTVKVAYEKPLGKLKVIKEDKDTKEKLSGAKFRVTGINNNINRTVTTNNSGEAKLSNLPFGRYRVAEITAPKGYEDDSKDGTVNITKQGEVTFTAQNSYIPEIPEMEKTVEGKTFTDVDFEKPYTYEIKTDMPEDIKGINKVEVTDDLDKNLEVLETRISIDNEPVDIEVLEEGNKVSYELRGKEAEKYKGKTILLEIDAQVKKGVDVISIDNTATVNVNNSYKVETDPTTVVPTIDIPVIKLWEKDHPLDRPESIKVILHSEETGAIEAELTEDGEWEHVFKELPEYNEDLGKIEYTLTEEETENYKSSIEKVNGVFVITNTWDTPIPDPEIEKDVDGKEHLEIDLEEEFNFNVTSDVPEDLLGYRNIKMWDVLDDRLEVVEAHILVDGERVQETPYQIGQTVYADLSRTELEKYKGQKLNLQITAKIRDEVKREEIDNIATIILNNEQDTDSNKVTVIPTPVELGLEKIQIYTDRETEKLPVKLDFRLDNYYPMYADEDIEIDLHQAKVDGEEVIPKELVDSKTVKLGDLQETLDMEVPREFLTKAEDERYVASIRTVNEDYIKVEDEEAQIDTDGYVSTEEDLEIDVEIDKEAEKVEIDLGYKTVEVDLGEETDEVYEFEGVIKTERVLGEDIEEDWETLTIPLDMVGQQKSGYGVEVEREVTYTNELEAGTEFEAGLFVDKELDESYIDYPEIDGYSFRDMESNITSEIENSNREEKHKFNLHDVYVERETGHLFSKEQRDANDSRIENDLVNGGSKIYTPIWIDELGQYDVIFKSLDPIGVHHVNFEVNDKLDIYAYMYAHRDVDGNISETIEEDEILIKPANINNATVGNSPGGWTQSDIDWLNE